MSASDITWVYAIVPADHRPPADVAGVAGEPLRVVAGPGIAAVVGAVPSADFDEEPLREHLADPAWLEHAVRAHHQVIGVLAQAGPVLPMRFATIYRTDERVAAMLQDQHGELQYVLGQLAGRSEWGVKIYLGKGSAVDAEEAHATNEAHTTDEQRPGTAYLLRRKTQQEGRDAAMRRAAEQAQQIHAALTVTAFAATCHPLQSPEASGRSEPMVLNSAYLVDDESFPVLETTIGTLAVEHPGLRVEVTGPWPPYSFSGVEPERQPKAAGR